MPKLNTIICTVLAIKGSSPLEFPTPVTVRLTDFHPPLEINAIQVTAKHELVLILVGGNEDLLKENHERFEKVINKVYERCEAVFGEYMLKHEAATA